MDLLFKKQTEELIDNLKGICATYGLGNDGNEFKIITQVFLYKFMNDKFGYEVKRLDEKLNKSANWEDEIAQYSDIKYESLLEDMDATSAKLQTKHYLSYLFNNQNQTDFAKFFDDTLINIAQNNGTFSVKTETGAKIPLFDRLSNFITDPSKRDEFARALISKLFEFNFEKAFHQRYDYFATIFEYLIKDYNKDGGGKYAEYYTPHAVARIMANILIGKDEDVSNVNCYDPSAGSGTLLISLAHTIGENKCTIFSQDISQKSSGMLRLNLILNNLVHSISNIIQGNTLLDPYHTERDGSLRKFDYIVSNPPFKLDFSDYSSKLNTDTNKSRFFAGAPNVPKTKKESMPIYLMFLQHIIYSLKEKGKAAVVVPTGFITAQSGIEKKIREKLIEDRMLKGVVSMPSNIFATTGTNVSVLFLDKSNKDGKVLLMDASKLGKKVKDGKNQKTILSKEEEDKIINTFNSKEVIEDFSILVSYEDIKAKNHSFSAGQYFDVKIEYVEISQEEFEQKINDYKTKLNAFFTESHNLEKEIQEQLELLRYD